MSTSTRTNPHPTGTSTSFNLWAHLRSKDAPATIAAFVFFFCLLTSFYLLRPVREEMGVRSGVGNLPWLFTGTFLVMVLATPVYGWCVSRFRRLGLIRGVYAFFISNLFVFYALLQTNTLPGITTTAFFIWVSVFNLFVVSVFWTVMSDVFNSDQSKLYYGFIAAGGSVGAIAGPTIASSTVGIVGVANLLLIAACFLIIPIWIVGFLFNWAQRNGQTQQTIPLQQPIGGSALASVKLMWTNPLLRMLAVYFLLFVTLSTFLYFEQIKIVGETFKSSTDRTAFFAKLDLATNTLTLLLQFGVTHWLQSRFGPFRSLMILPVITLMGFVVLVFAPTLWPLAVFNVLRRAVDFAVARPAREAIFTLVSVEERYKAKNLIDTTVYRGGDALSAWFVALVRQLTGNAAALAVIAVPISLAWLVNVWWIGRKGEQVCAGTASSSRPTDAP